MHLSCPHLLEGQIFCCHCLGLGLDLECCTFKETLLAKTECLCHAYVIYFRAWGANCIPAPQGRICPHPSRKVVTEAVRCYGYRGLWGLGHASGRSIWRNVSKILGPLGSSLMRPPSSKGVGIQASGPSNGRANRERGSKCAPVMQSPWGVSSQQHCVHS